MTITTILVILVLLLTLVIIRQKSKHESELNKLSIKKLEEKTTQVHHDSNQTIAKYTEVSNLKWENFQLKLENMLLQGKLDATNLVSRDHVKLLTNSYAVPTDPAQLSPANPTKTSEGCSSFSHSIASDSAEKNIPTEVVFDISDEVTHVH